MAILFKLLFFLPLQEFPLVAPAPRKKYNSFQSISIAIRAKNTNPWKNSHSKSCFISSVSVLHQAFYQGDSLFIVSDNSGFLYEYTIGTGTVNDIHYLKCDTKYSQARQA
jgi:hypothetical protein